MCSDHPRGPRRFLWRMPPRCARKGLPSLVLTLPSLPPPPPPPPAAWRLSLSPYLACVLSPPASTRVRDAWTPPTSLQVLELTDVALDDSMLGVLGEIFTSARPASSSSSSSAAAASSEEGGGEPYNIFFAGAAGDGGRGVESGPEESNIRLRTLILGRCGGVSEAAFETFLGQAGGGMVGARESSSARRGSGSGSGSGTVGKDRGGAAATDGFGLALSTVRLQGCKALGDRGLALLCAGAKRLDDVQVLACLVGFSREHWVMTMVMTMMGLSPISFSPPSPSPSPSLVPSFFPSVSLSLSSALSVSEQCPSSEGWRLGDLNVSDFVGSTVVLSVP